MNDQSITAPGGWFAPSEALYDLEQNWGRHLAPERVELPMVKVARGGIDFNVVHQMTEAERAARDAMQALIARHIGNIREAQADIEDSAVFFALVENYAVHFQESHDSRFVGIEFTERRLGGRLVNVHRDDSWWEHREEDGWEW